MTIATGTLLLLLGLAVVLTTLSALLLRGTTPAGAGYNTPARIFLVGLRLAIGWHCLVEGLHKLDTPAWSSEAYLRESVGPLAGFYRDLAGERVAEKLTVTEKGEVPAPLAREWDVYLENFAEHYDLTAEQRQQAEDKLRQAKKDVYTWLTVSEEDVTLPSPYPPPVSVPLTIQQRVEKLHKLQARVDELQAQFPTTDKGLHDRLKTAKADLNKWRSDLKRSYDARFNEMKQNLHKDVLTDEQKAQPPLAGPVRTTPTEWTLLEWSDKVVTYGLIGLGVLLLVGLFSRISSGLAALLLLSFYVAMPPLPGWPESPRLEGHYLYVNKTLIEAIALGALAFIPTGRWAGLDGLLSLAFGRHDRAAAPAKLPEAKTPEKVAGAH